MASRFSARRSLLAIATTIGLIAPLSAVSPPPVALAASPTVVTAVDFNDSTTGTWTQSGGPTLAYVADGGGGQALSITRAADYEGIQSPAGLLELDVEYTFSMRAMLDPAGSVTSGDIRFVVKPAYNWVANTTINNTGWTTITGTYTVPAGTDPTATQVYIGTPDLTGPYTVLIDDILITRPAVVPPTTTITAVDFNDSTTGTWTQSGGPTLAYVADGGGGQALSITRAADYEGIQSPAGLLELDVEYTFSMRAMLDPAGSVTSGDIRFVVKPAYNWVANTTINNTGWTTITGTYTVPAGTDPTATQVYIGTPDLTGPYTVLIDDILITTPLVTPPATATITAVDFNDSTTSDWVQSGGPTLTYVDDGSGGMALSILRANTWDGISSPTGLLETDVEYTFSMRARLPEGASGTPGVRLTVYRNDGSDHYDWVGNAAISAAGWTTITGTYTLPAGSNTSTAKISVDSDNQTDPYILLVDDILVTGPAPSGGTGVLDSDCSNGYVALTFDDGPYAGQTDKLVTALDAAHLRGTFFDWGQHIAGNTSLMLLQSGNGWIGNHSWDHQDLTTLTEGQITTQLTDTSNAIQAATGEAPVLMRPPYGATNATVKTVEATLGLTEILWDVDTQDWNGFTAAQIIAAVKTAQAGQVILMHDNLATTRNAIPGIADALTTKKMCPGMISPVTGKAVAPPAQQVISTDFESGLDGWGPRDAQGTPTVALTEDESHSPTHAALVSNRTGQGDGIGHDATGIMKAGVKYNISAWVKFATGSPADSIWLSMRRTNGTADSFDTIAQFTNVPGDSWKQVTASYTVGAYDSAFIYFETTYPDGTTANFLLDDVVVEAQSGPSVQLDLTNLKDTVSFPIGVAIDSRETTGAYAQLLLKHFDQITPENHMKPEAWYDADKNFRIHPEAVALMDFAAANGLRVYGHTLVWHSQTPDWFFQRDDGTPLTNSPADQTILRNRLHDHIFNIAETLSDLYGPFGSATNPLVAFDVVNEVISDSSAEADGLRRSAWYNVLGPSYIEDAFNYAEQAFNVDHAAVGVTRPIKLVINDYNTEQSGKGGRLHALIENLLDDGVPVDIVGHQFHVSLSTNVQTLDDALTAFEDLPVMQAVTELDVMTGSPVDDAKLIEQGYFYRDLFRVLRAHSASIFSATIWGLYDGRSWRSDNYPLLFTDALQAKQAFYGAVDEELKARIRSANVFQADVPLDGSATTAFEWRKLALHMFGDANKVSFQLRWVSDHMSAYVAVKDNTVDATDAVAFTLEGTTYSFNRNGTGDVSGEASEVAGGWVAVVHLPLSGAEASDTLQFDISVTDGTATVGWNDAGAMGTLTLVEALSFMEIGPAGSAPSIDGLEDPVWELANVNTVHTDKQVTGSGTASAAVRALWYGNYLYVFMHVTDPVLDVSASSPWEQDSVEIYVDNVNAKNGAYRADDTQIRINYQNLASFGTGDEAAQQARLTSATQVVADGYVVEARISLLAAGGPDSFIGVDYQVNDASGGRRIGIRNWADPTNAGYLNTSHWGVAWLAPTGPVPGLPSEPLGVGASAFNQSAFVSWSAPAHTGGSAIIGYEVTDGSGHGCTTTGALSCTVAGLTNGVTYSLHVRAVNGVGPGAWSASVDVVPRLGSTYVPLIPTRILDTYGPIGSSGGAPIAKAPIRARTPLTFDVANQAIGDALRNVPVNATAVTGVLSVSHGPVLGLLTLTPVPTSNPTTSTLNFPRNDARATGVTISLGAGGTLSVTYAGTTIGTVDVAFDVTGYFIEGTSGATYDTLTPTRILDSRKGLGQTGGKAAPFRSGIHQCFQVSGQAGVPAGAVAVTGNLTVTYQTSAGKVAFGPEPDDAPVIGTIYAPKWVRYVAPDARATGVTIKLGSGGTLCAVWVGAAGSSAAVIFDVNGYFVAGGSGAMYVPITPNRILDTRKSLGTTRLVGLKSKSFQVVNRNPTDQTTNVPSNAIAVTGTLTVTRQQLLGFLALTPTRQDVPTTSTLNFLKYVNRQPDNRATGVTVPLGSGLLWVTYAPTRYAYTDAIFDVSGYFVYQGTSTAARASQNLHGEVAPVQL